MFPEREIAQAITWIRACVLVGQLPMPLQVALVQGQESERFAWRNAAVDYLKARESGVTFREIQRRFKEALDDQG
jgi:hypothetical protein